MTKKEIIYAAEDVLSCGEKHIVTTTAAASTNKSAITDIKSNIQHVLLFDLQSD